MEGVAFLVELHFWPYFQGERSNQGQNYRKHLAIVNNYCDKVWLKSNVLCGCYNHLKSVARRRKKERRNAEETKHLATFVAKCN